MAAKKKADQPVAVSPYSFESFISFVNGNFSLLLVGGLLFIAGFFVGSLWTENELLKSGGVGSAGTGTAPTADAGVPQPTTPPPVDQVPEVTSEDHIRGNKNAKVILVEYSDFECPFCARFHPTMEQVMEEYGDDVAWVYRHYPLSFHPNAQAAAEASECVAAQLGDTGFWSFADAISEVTNTDGKLSEDAIQETAQAVGVNMTTFNTCLDSGQMAEKVKNQMAGGSTAGVTGTPGTIVVTKDGGQELIPGALPFAQVQTIVDTYL
jgi:protein-disulfide isomerase